MFLITLRLHTSSTVAQAWETILKAEQETQRLHAQESQLIFELVHEPLAKLLDELEVQKKKVFPLSTLPSNVAKAHKRWQFSIKDSQ